MTRAARIEKTFKRHLPLTNATWKQGNKTTADADKPWIKVVAASTDTKCRIIFIESRDREKEFQFKRFLAETDLPTDGTYCIFYPQGFVPMVGDVVVRDSGEEYTCNSDPREYKPFNETLIYIAGLE